MTVRYRRHPESRLTDVEGEGVVLHLGTRRYYTVNETGLLILETLTTPRTADEVVAAVLERYESPAEPAGASVAHFLARCEGARLVIAETVV